MDETYLQNLGILTKSLLTELGNKTQCIFTDYHLLELKLLEQKLTKVPIFGPSDLGIRKGAFCWEIVLGHPGS